MCYFWVGLETLLATNAREPSLVVGGGELLQPLLGGDGGGLGTQGAEAVGTEAVTRCGTKEATQQTHRAASLGGTQGDVAPCTVAVSPKDAGGRKRLAAMQRYCKKERRKHIALKNKLLQNFTRLELRTGEKMGKMLNLPKYGKESGGGARTREESFDCKEKKTNRKTGKITPICAKQEKLPLFLRFSVELTGIWMTLI